MPQPQDLAPVSGPPTGSSALPVAVPPLLASIWSPLPTGRPSTEWQPPQGLQRQQGLPAPQKQLIPDALPLSPHHCHCSAY